MTNKHPENLGRFFADIVCSRHNQNVMIRFVAIAGMGKSWAALRLAYEISKYISMKMGGTPEKYFNPNEDLAVISLEETQRVMNTPNPYHVKMLDDVAAKAMNARDYAKKSSKDMNAIVTTWRPFHNALITTQQAGFLVDKVWRNLFNFQIEIVNSDFDNGIVLCKVQRIVYKHNTGKTFYPFLQKGNVKYIRHIIGSPPDSWQQAYEVERAKQLEAIRKREEEEEKEDQKEHKKTLAETKFELKRDFEAGVYEGLTLKQVCKAKGINYRSLLSC